MGGLGTLLRELNGIQDVRRLTAALYKQEPEVRRRIAQHTANSIVLTLLSNDREAVVVDAVVHNPATPGRVIAGLLAHPDSSVREAAALSLTYTTGFGSTADDDPHTDAVYEWVENTRDSSVDKLKRRMTR